MSTPTPRTDAMMKQWHVAHDAMWIDFARRLERELAQAQARIAELEYRLVEANRTALEAIEDRDCSDRLRRDALHKLTAASGLLAALERMASIAVTHPHLWPDFADYAIAAARDAGIKGDKQ